MPRRNVRQKNIASGIALLAVASPGLVQVVGRLLGSVLGSEAPSP